MTPTDTTGRAWAILFATHDIPRAALLLVLVMPHAEDRFSVDGWLVRRAPAAPKE